MRASVKFEFREFQPESFFFFVVSYNCGRTEIFNITHFDYIIFDAHICRNETRQAIHCQQMCCFNIHILIRINLF